MDTDFLGPLIFIKHANIYISLMDFTACQPIWVMLCRNELCDRSLGVVHSNQSAGQEGP